MEEQKSAGNGGVTQSGREDGEEQVEMIERTRGMPFVKFGEKGKMKKACERNKEAQSG
jgi:hypothetical protein